MAILELPEFCSVSTKSPPAEEHLAVEIISDFYLKVNAGLDARGREHRANDGRRTARGSCRCLVRRPDERMPPTEFVRFPQIDESWTEALIDGALGFGGVNAADTRRDNAFRLRQRDRRQARLRISFT
jgi:hypothetical protein